MPKGRKGPARFIGYPTDSLLAVLPDAGRAASAAAALRSAGARDADLTILRGQEGASRLDPTGAEHGPMARIGRIVAFTTSDQLPDMAWYQGAVMEGQVVLMAKVRGDERKSVAVRVLREHGGHFINYYGRLATEEIDRWRGPEPDVPSILKR
jgi:hypothetical protein